MKAMLCLECSDILAPYLENGRWRYCACGSSAMRWTDGRAGKAEVSNFNGNGPLIIGLDNAFLSAGVRGRHLSAAAWRGLHAGTTESVEKHYLFHRERRDCWALIVHPGDTGDVTWSPWPTEESHDDEQTS